MRLSRGTLVPVAVVALSLISAEGVAAKCSREIQMPGFEPGEPVVFLDGLFVPNGFNVPGESSALDEVDPDDVLTLRIACWNPATGEVEISVGVPVILVWTKSVMESTRTPIRDLLRAQQAYFSQHSRYARRLGDLVGFGLPRGAMLEFSATSAGWSATTPGGDVAHRCSVFSGNATQALAGMMEHKVVCQPEEGKVNRAMREMYESLIRG